MLHKKNEDRESCLARREFLKLAGAAAAGIYLAGDDSPAKAQTPAAAPSAKKPMIVWICTDMEALAGIDQYEQCFDPDESPKYQHGREQLTADTNAAVAGCFDAGATAVYVIDGHWRNHNRGFILDKFDKRAKLVSTESDQGVDESVHAVAMIGQHSMAGTLHGFLDHTQIMKELCRFIINGEDYGEMGQFAMYAGAFGVPLAYVSGDEAPVAEARRQFPHVKCTPTKRGTGWATCQLYPVQQSAGQHPPRHRRGPANRRSLEGVAGEAAHRAYGRVGVERQGRPLRRHSRRDAAGRPHDALEDCRSP